MRPRWHGFVLGHERQPSVDLPIGARRAARHVHLTQVDRDEAGDRPHQRRLARAVGAEQARDPGAERAAELGERDLGPNHTDTSVAVTVASATKAGSPVPSSWSRSMRGRCAVIAPPTGSGRAAPRSPRAGRRRTSGGRATRRRRRRRSGESESTWPRNTTSRQVQRQRQDVEERGGRAAVYLEVADDDARRDRRHEEQADHRGARDDPSLGERRDRHADDRGAHRSSTTATAPPTGSRGAR